MINKFFTVFISISLILIIISPIIINAMEFDSIEFNIENSEEEEEKENKSEFSKEFEIDCYFLNTKTSTYAYTSSKHNFFIIQQEYLALTKELYAPPPENNLISVS